MIRIYVRVWQSSLRGNWFIEEAESYLQERGSQITDAEICY